MAEKLPTLEQLRDQIDSLDKQIHELLNQRATVAQGVAEVKLAQAMQNPEEEVLFYRPEREAQVLRKVKERNTGPLPDDHVAHIFREIMSACLALEKPLEVAFLGPEGTFTHGATIKHFGHAVRANPVATIDQVFADVTSGQAMYGVVPVENSTEGMVNHTLDSFIHSDLQICGEVELPIDLHLLFNPHAKASDIKKICAHQQALAQSRTWLDRHYPNIPREAVSSNAMAASLAAEDVSIAAVAGDMAAQLYQLQVSAGSIQDLSKNTTRFLIVGNEKVQASGVDKTSIVVATDNKPGALYHLLEPFHRESIMLTRIDTRPSKTENWTYLFFIDFEGHQEDKNVQLVLNEIERNSKSLKVLGSYPKAVI